MNVTLNTHWLLTGMLAPDKAIPVGAVVVRVPPHTVAEELPTVSPAGSVSENATPLSATGLIAGLVMVNVRVLGTFGAMTFGLNDLLIEGGTTTTMLAEAVAPVIPTKLPEPSSKAPVMLLVVLFLTPELAPATSTDSEQLEEPGRTNATRLMLLLPGLAVTAAPSARQLPVTLLGEATTSPLGSMSLNEMLISSVVEFGLATIKLSDVVPFNGMLVSPKALDKVGGRTVGAVFTVKLAVLLVAPGPLSLAEIGPVVLFITPVVVACTATEIKHAPVAALDDCDSAGMDARCRGAIDSTGSRAGSNATTGATMPPERLMEEEPGTAVTVPPQLLFSWLGDATTKPAGKASVN